MDRSIIPVPQTIQETGIGRNFLEGLALKILYIEGELSLVELAEHIRLNLPIVQELFQRLRKNELCQVQSMQAGVHRIVATSRGKAEAVELLSQSQYVGPAPVSLSDYAKRIRTQTIRDLDVHPPDVARAFTDYVLRPETLLQIGTAVVSGRSIFIYGPSGTGKTAIAQTLPSVYDDGVWIPYSVEVAGQVIVVYDSDLHERIEDVPESDGRWVYCRRPRVVVGGELTSEMLELQLNPVTRFYSAPLQMKAANGVLVIDDFGRQRVRPEELLNRWIVPLDRGVEFLTLAGGKTFEIPFDTFVVFATNLDPSSLMDDAFLRRIQTKVKVGYVNREEFQEIFRRVCGKSGLTYEQDAVEHLMDTLDDLNQPLRPCYPRDFVEQIGWRARYEGRQPELDREALSQACRNYFVMPDLEDAQSAKPVPIQYDSQRRYVS